MGDAEAIARLISACGLVDGGESDVKAEEVIDDWADLDLPEESVLVEDPDGGAAAYADVVDAGHVSVSVYGYVDPDHRGRGIGASLVAWGEDRARGGIALAPEGVRVVAQHYVSSPNDGARLLLESVGYVPVRGTYVMETRLREPPPPPVWPEGLKARTFVLGRDERAAHEAVEDAFLDLWGRPQGTFERFLRLTEKETFDPSLWFLATEGGEIAGVVLGKTVAGEGWVDVVGVRRPWRGRGLGLALLRHALGEYRRRGVSRVGLSVDAESVTGAPRLYGRAGMSVVSSYIRYQKELRSGVDTTAR